MGAFIEYFGAAQRFPGAGLDAGGVSFQVNFLANFDDFGFDARARRFDDVKAGIHDFGTNSVAVRDRDAGYVGHSFERLKYHVALGHALRNDFFRGVSNGPAGHQRS